MVGNIKVSGSTITCMEAVYIHGKTAASMKVSTKMTKNTALVCIPGRMDVVIRDSGPEANNMVSGPTQYHSRKSNVVSGKKANALSGSTTSKLYRYPRAP